MITLYIPAVGPSTRASASECGRLYTHLKSLCWPSVYFQVYRPTFVLSVFRASPLECMRVKDSCFCNVRFLQRNLSSGLLLARVDCFFLLQKLGAVISYLLAPRCVCVSHIHTHTHSHLLNNIPKQSLLFMEFWG